MTSHFLLSAQARTLSLRAVYKAGEDKAYETFRAIRWASTAGRPVCPRCACERVYDLTTRRRYKCAACYAQFSVTSGTIFHSRKMAFVDLLGAIALFVNAVKGVSALQMARDLDCQYKGAAIFADEASHWDALEASFPTTRINHSETYSDGHGKHTNWVESYFSRLRRMVRGQHHGVSAKLLHAYAAHAAWCEDHRRRDNGANAFAVVGNALLSPVSHAWCGYWQQTAT